MVRHTLGIAAVLLLLAGCGGSSGGGCIVTPTTRAGTSCAVGGVTYHLTRPGGSGQLPTISATVVGARFAHQVSGPGIVNTATGTFLVVSTRLTNVSVAAQPGVGLFQFALIGRSGSRILQTFGAVQADGHSCVAEIDDDANGFGPGVVPGATLTCDTVFDLDRSEVATAERNGAVLAVCNFGQGLIRRTGTITATTAAALEIGAVHPTGS